MTPRVSTCTVIFLSASCFAQADLAVRGSAPFRTTLDGRPYPEYGQIHLRCDDGRCTLQKASMLCDRPTAELSQAVVAADRIQLLQTPTRAKPTLGLKIEDFGTDYKCAVTVRPSTNPPGVWHIESYECSYSSSWHGGRTKIERSVRSLAVREACPGLILQQSSY